MARAPARRLAPSCLTWRHGQGGVSFLLRMPIPLCRTQSPTNFARPPFNESVFSRSKPWQPALPQTCLKRSPDSSSSADLPEMGRTIDRNRRPACHPLESTPPAFFIAAWVRGAAVARESVDACSGSSGDPASMYRRLMGRIRTFQHMRIRVRNRCVASSAVLHLIWEAETHTRTHTKKSHMQFGTLLGGCITSRISRSEGCSFAHRFALLLASMCFAHASFARYLIQSCRTARSNCILHCILLQ